MATWRSGYAAVCKTVYTSSILVVASTHFAHLRVPTSRGLRAGARSGVPLTAGIGLPLPDRFGAHVRRCRAIASAKRAIEVRQIAKAGIKSDSADRARQLHGIAQHSIDAREALIEQVSREACPV